ncbi:MAG TPA: cellulose binding domain-containing protein, partial [Herpetosiphonaceae bacterium]|nr:cellulose binding domain-containing protein [Herpetosiphonaceae bacterium]
MTTSPSQFGLRGLLALLLLAAIGLGRLGPGAPATAAAAGCEVTYAIANQWADGFTADVTIKNNGAAVSAWTL